MNEATMLKSTPIRYFTGTRHRDLKRSVRFVDVDKITQIVTDHFKIPFDVLCIRCRKKEVVYCRQVLMYFLHKYTNLSLKSIGEMFIGKCRKGKDHTTVIHSADLIKDRMDAEDSVFYEIKDLEEKILDMKIKITSETDLLSIAAKSVHILNNLSNAQKQFDECPGFASRQNLKRWRQISDEYLKEISGNEYKHNAESLKINLVISGSAEA